MTTLAEMRSEVARDHGWHEDDDGDRIDEVLNERFGQAAVEMYAALALALEYWSHRQQRYRNRRPVWVKEAEAALSKARAQ